MSCSRPVSGAIAAFVAIILCVSDQLFGDTVYVAERDNGNVVAIDIDTGEATIAASELGSMIGATVDRRGRLFVFRFDAQAVALVDLETNTFTDIAVGINGHGLFADPDSDTLYVAGYTDGKVYKLAETEGGVWDLTVVADEADGLVEPIGTYLIDNSLYISDRGAGALYVTNLATGTTELVVELPSGGEIIDREAGGDLIIGTSASDIYRVDLESGSIVGVYEGFANPAGIIVDPSDNQVIVCEHDGSRVLKLNLDTNERTLVTEDVETPWQPAMFKPSTPDPVGMLQDLVVEVALLNLAHGIENSLDAKLDTALSALQDANANNDIAACNSLQAFAAAVEAQRGKKILDESADHLIALAHAIHEVVCP